MSPIPANQRNGCVLDKGFLDPLLWQVIGQGDFPEFSVRLADHVQVSNRSRVVYKWLNKALRRIRLLGELLHVRDRAVDRIERDWRRRSG